ncbi:MAG: TVP38/TMEM64 family protein, partial [Nitrospirae bacterium]|nr:TVP38/TMEM64 family protein [Candidatus Troglogloeales bacterium]
GLSSKVKLGMVLAVFAALFVLAKYLNVQELLKKSLDAISGLGPLGDLIFISIYMLACVLFLPGAILTLGAGAIFGVVKGSMLVSVGSTLGATCAFLVGRYVARGWVVKKIEGNKKFKAIDEAIASEGWKIVGLTRLSPVFPFSLLNYAYGVTNVTLKDYFFASWIGMITGTVMYVYIGSLAGDVATAGGAKSPGIAQWAIRIIGLLATIAVTVFITKIAKKGLEKQV